MEGDTAERLAIARERIELERIRSALELEKREWQVAKDEAALQAERESLAQLKAQVESCKKALEDERRKLEEEKRQWLKHKGRVDVNDLGERVTLNVGGKKFTTLLVTLQNAKGMLGAMFSGRFDVLLDEEGCVFLDRNGVLFEQILEIVRNQQKYVPPTCIDLPSLQREMEYFALAPLYASKRIELDRPRSDAGIIEYTSQTYQLESEYEFLRFSFRPGIQYSGNDVGIHFSPRVLHREGSGDSQEWLLWPMCGILSMRAISQRESVRDKCLAVDVRKMGHEALTRLLNGAAFGDEFFIKEGEAEAFFKMNNKIEVLVEFYPRQS